MKHEDVKRSWDGIAALFTICLQRGTFRSIAENQAALNDLAVVESFLKEAMAPAKQTDPADPVEGLNAGA